MKIKPEKGRQWSWLLFTIFLLSLLSFQYLSISWYSTQEFIDLQGVGYLLAIAIVTLLLAILTINRGLKACGSTAKAWIKALGIVVLVLVLIYSVFYLAEEYNFFNLIQLNQVKELNAELRQVISNRYQVELNSCYTENGRYLIISDYCNQRHNQAKQLQVLNTSGEIVYQVSMDELLNKIISQFNLAEDTRFAQLTLVHSKYDVRVGKIEYQAIAEHFALVEVVNDQMKTRHNYAISYDGKDLLVKENHKLDYEQPYIVID